MIILEDTGTWITISKETCTFNQIVTHSDEIISV